LAKEYWSKNQKKEVPSSKRKVSAVVVDKKKSDLDEYLLSTVESEVNNPDLWIASTSATVYMTSYKNKLINVKTQITSNMITMGNGSQELGRVSDEVIGLVKGKKK
jgi:hypothetical protein